MLSKRSLRDETLKNRGDGSIEQSWVETSGSKSLIQGLHSYSWPQFSNKVCTKTEITFYIGNVSLAAAHNIQTLVMPTPPCRSNVVGRSKEGSSLAIWFFTARLLQLTDNLVQSLQAVPYAAVCLVTGIRWCEHIMPVLRQLYWLPVQQSIEFKMAVLV